MIEITKIRDFIRFPNNGKKKSGKPGKSAFLRPPGLKDADVYNQFKINQINHSPKKKSNES
jgi:hypothetical protein